MNLTSIFPYVAACVDYIFGTTATETDAPEKRKYDEILEDVKPLLSANPGYKLYVTGHSLVRKRRFEPCVRVPDSTTFLTIPLHYRELRCRV